MTSKSEPLLPSTDYETIVLYQAEEGRTALDVQLNDETVWLSQQQMASLFGTERGVITKHIDNIFKTEVLARDAVCAKIAHTAAGGFDSKALVALALLTATSDPAQKELMIRLIVNLLDGNQSRETVGIQHG